MGALRVLVSFYTMFHMNITQEDMDAMETRFYLTPLVGLIFGSLVLLDTAVLLWLFDNIIIDPPYSRAVAIISI